MDRLLAGGGSSGGGSGGGGGGAAGAAGAADGEAAAAVAEGAAAEDAAEAAALDALERLLLWLATYSDLFSRRCAATGRLLCWEQGSAAPLPPVVRPFRVGRRRLEAAARDPALREAYHAHAAPRGWLDGECGGGGGGAGDVGAPGGGAVARLLAAV